jgi:hypothetical protein
MEMEITINFKPNHKFVEKYNRLPRKMKNLVLFELKEICKICFNVLVNWAGRSKEDRRPCKTEAPGSNPGQSTKSESYKGG